MTPISAGRAIDGVRPQSVAFLIDRNGTYVGVYAHRKDHLLADPQDIIGRSVHDIMVPHLADAVLIVVKKVLTTGYPSTFSYTAECHLAPDEVRYRTAVVTRYDAHTALWDAIDWTDLEVFPHVLAEMTDTEKAVWELTAQGRTAKEISAQLGISTRSVARYRKRSRERFGRYVPLSGKAPYSS